MRNIVILVVILIAIVSCGEGGYNETFTKIDKLCDNNPQKAILMLDSIEYASLSERDRHCHDLLSIKAHDKAYLQHTSDSLILDVIDYFTSHRDQKLYPEALYYGGRVYADLDSGLKAMEYFHKALEEEPGNYGNQKLKGQILSQSGRLLDNLGLHSMAVPYLEEAIAISKELNDSVSMVYDYISLTESYLNKMDAVSARRHLEEAMRHSQPLPECDKAWLQVILAAVLLIENKTDSAINTIRPHIHKVDSLCYNYALANAAEIYLFAGVTDTASMYAKELVERESDNNRHVGYKLLLSDDLSYSITTDSLRKYLNEYKCSLNRHSNYNDDAAKILQQNYRPDDSNTNEMFSRQTIPIIVILLIVCVTVTAYLFKHKKIDNADKRTKEAKHSHDKGKSENDATVLLEQRNLRTKIMSEIALSDIKSVSETILNSNVYAEISKCLKNGKSVINNEKIWTDLRKTILTDSPDFITKINTLTAGKYTQHNLHTAFLIRCGFSPSDLAILLGITKSAASDRRASLSRLIFDNKNSIKLLDDLIYSL